MASDTETANLALQKLGAARITSLTEDSRNARSINSCYASVRDQELRSHPWNFPRRRTTIAADATAPAYGYNYAFTLPADCLRILKPNDTYLDWQIEGKKILTNQPEGNTTAPILNLTYVARITDMNEWDTLAVDALATRLAIQCCIEIKDNGGDLRDLREQYRDVVRLARRTNAMEQIPADAPVDAWDLARL